MFPASSEGRRRREAQELELETGCLRRRLAEIAHEIDLAHTARLDRFLAPSVGLRRVRLVEQPMAEIPGAMLRRAREVILVRPARDPDVAAIYDPFTDETNASVIDGVPTAFEVSLAENAKSIVG